MEHQRHQAADAAALSIATEIEEHVTPKTTEGAADETAERVIPTRGSQRRERLDTPGPARASRPRHHDRADLGRRAGSRVLLRIEGYAIAILSVALAYGGALLMHGFEQTASILFLGAVTVSAWAGGMGPGIVATVLSSLLLDYFFIPEIHLFDLGPAVALSLGVFVLVAVLISSLNASRRRLESALRAENEQQSEFMAVLAHELRNFLAPLPSAIEILRMRAHNDPAVDHSCGVVERQSRAMSRLVDDLLDLARVQRGKVRLVLEPVHLEAVVNQALQTVQPMFEARGHRLEISLSPGPLVLEADRLRLEQVLVNLLTNAAKYTKPGGWVRLTAERHDRELVVRVKDNGEGIDPELLPRVFEIFTQAKEDSEAGLGIGLGLVRGLVEMHGGSVVAFSEGVGCGSEFVVRLPASVGSDEARRVGDPGRKATPREVAVGR